MAGNRDAYERAMRTAIEQSQKHNWQAAYGAYRQAVIEFPQDVSAVLGLGNALLESGQLQGALKVFEQASRIAPHEARVLSSLADVQERLASEMPVPAPAPVPPPGVEMRDMLTLTASRQTASRRTDVQGEWKDTLAKTDNVEETLVFESETEEIAGDDSPFQRARRLALQELADTLFAVEESEHGPKPAVAAAISRAIDQQTRGLADEAIGIFRKALDGGFNRTALFFNLGALYYERRHYEKAIETFRHSMRDEDFRLGSHYALSLTYLAAGMLDRALEHLLEVVKTVDLQMASAMQIGELTLAYQRLADGYIAKSDTQKANVFAQTLVNFFSRPRWEQRARQARHDMDQLSENGSPMTLAEYLETPETEVIVTSLNLTAEYMHRNMLATAVEECLYAIERVPYHLPLHVRLAKILAAQERHNQAIVTSMTVAEVYQVRGQLQAAVNICQAVLQQTPMEAQARQKLVELLLGQDETDQALEQYLALADTHYQLAEVDHALATYDEALRLASKSPNRSRWEITFFRRIGDISIQRVDWVRATWAYESIAAHAPEDDNARLILIDLYYKQRQRDKALQSFDRLLAIYQKLGKSQNLPGVFHELVQTYPDEVGLRARVAAGYVAQGLTRQAIEEYTALSKLQLKAGLRGEASRTIQTLIELSPERADDYRRLLAQLQGRSALPAP